MRRKRGSTPGRKQYQRTGQQRTVVVCFYAKHLENGEG